MLKNCPIKSVGMYHWADVIRIGNNGEYIDKMYLILDKDGNKHFHSFYFSELKDGNQLRRVTCFHGFGVDIWNRTYCKTNLIKNAS